jgi:LPS sulfotransferase NodH
MYGQQYPERSLGAGRPSSVGDENQRLPFIVFGNQRTGSTLIANRLNSHRRIMCYEEIFLPWVDSEPSLRGWLRTHGRPQWLRAVPGTKNAFLAALFESEHLSNEIEAIGFKVMYDQISLWPKLAYYVPSAGRLLEDPLFRRWLHANRVLIVHTLRRNHLKLVVSHKLAAGSGRFHSRDAGTSGRQIVLPLRGLKTRLMRIEAAERTARKIVKDLPTIEIYYEDYVSSEEAADDARLCRALGQSVPVGGLTSSLAKVTSDHLRDVIQNYEQVAAHLSGTRFARFLE